MTWRFRFLSIAIVILLVGGAAAIMRPRPVAVEAVRVVRAPLELKVVETGRARVRERYVLSAPIIGTLARVELREGDVVEPGAVLARLLPLASPLLDPDSRRATEQRLASAIDGARQAQATVARAELASDKAARDLAREQELFEQGAATVAQRDQASVESRMRDAELTSARFAERIATHEIEQVRAALARFRPGASRSEQLEVTSPVHGQVLHVFHQSEGVVAAGAPILEVGDPTALELVVDVRSQDAVAIRPGMSAGVVRWGGDGALRATVRRVEPAAFTKTSALGVDEQRVNLLLDPDGPVSAWSGLGDGYAVDVEVVVWSKPDALQVPTSSLLRDGSGWIVYAIEDGRVRTRPVRIDHSGPLATEAVEGLTEGERVVGHPGGAVRDGVRVMAR